MHDHQIDSPKGVTSLKLPQAPEGARTLENVKAYCTSIGLNPSQAQALRSVVAGLLTIKPNPHVRLVQGPPGTGKTSMLVALLSVLGCLHRRTLISAPTNAAVVEIATRMMTNFFQDRGGEQKKQFSKYCTEDLQMPPSTSRIEAIRQWSPLELREIVLVGSLERLRGAVDDTLLTKVFLPYRAKRLLAALRGWKDSLNSLVKFIEDAPGGYARTTSIECQENLPNQIPNDPFWKFAGQFMKGMKSELEKYSSVLVSELPRCRLDERTSNAITKVCDLLKELVASMPSEAPKGAVSWFTASKTDILVETFSSMNLVDVGRKGISKFVEIKELLLETLMSSTRRKLIDSMNPLECKLKRDWLQSLCLKEATLVFSTVSSAGGKKMRNIPFECGIVDEASQLVEAATTIITSNTKLKQLILVGDHKQLPATVISKVDRSASHHVPHNFSRVSLPSSDILLFCISRILQNSERLHNIILD